MIDGIAIRLAARSDAAAIAAMSREAIEYGLPWGWQEQRVAAAMRAPAAILAGELDLGTMKAVMRRARVLDCNDAGARHVAVALGVPSVVLFGPTSLAKTNLNLERVRALVRDAAA